MAGYRLSRRAASDLDAIFEYTVGYFGVEQARKYLGALHACCERLAKNPRLGRTAESLAPDLRRLEFRSHVLFYLPESDGVLIVRVLHERMEAQRHV